MFFKRNVTACPIYSNNACTNREHQQEVPPKCIKWYDHLRRSWDAKIQTRLIVMLFLHFLCCCIRMSETSNVVSALTLA